MKLFVKVFLIALSLFSFSSFAVNYSYTSILKKDTTKVKTFSEFQNNMKKDFLEIRRKLASQPAVFVSIKETKTKSRSKKINPSSI